MSEHKVHVRIIGPTGSGKTAVYAKLVDLLKVTDATVVHADQSHWTMMQNSGETADNWHNPELFRPVITIEEVPQSEFRSDEAFGAIMRYFEKHDTLPKSVNRMVEPIAMLAKEINARVPAGPEKSAALRKLLEAQDCIVRQLLLASENGVGGL